MMDGSAVRAVVERELAMMALSLGLQHWDILVTYHPKPPDGDGWHDRGECLWHPDYDRASINFNPNAFETEDQVLKTLRHELFHVVMAPYGVFWNVVERALRDDPVKLAMLDAVFTHAKEQGVIALERMHYGLTLERLS